MTSSMLLMGVALNKAALLTFFVSIVVSVVLFAWSLASFADGVGITGVLAVLVPFFAWAECYRVSTQAYETILQNDFQPRATF